MSSPENDYQSISAMNSATLRSYATAVISSYAEILFLQDPRFGVGLLLILLVNINITLSGLIAVFSVLAFAYFIRMKAEFLENGFYIYNPLLVGMSIGFIFQVTAISVVLIMMAAILTFLMTIVLYHLFSKASIPILSLPFTLVSTLIYLASLNYTSLYTQALYVRPAVIELLFLPDTLNMYLKALGTIFFLPYSGIGLLLAMGLLLYSRIMLILSLIGLYVGVFVHSLMLGSWQIALSNPYTFNYILIAIALGAIFLVPSIRSVLIAMIGVAMSVLLIDASSSFWTIYKIPVFTLPFNVIVISFLFVLRSVRFKEFAYDIKKTPESTLRSSILSFFRFKSGEINLFLPFSGKWSVYQGFDGQWTHQGRWRYAYDFVIMKDGRSYKDDGAYLEDYYAYKKPVLSPVSGYVYDLEAGVEDNPIGQVNTIRNWGNYIVIQSHLGDFIELSHFAQGSLKVRKGDLVEAGQLLGSCGNSGYSPQPHIHVQVQENMLLGSQTLPFRFVSYIDGKHIRFNQDPDEAQEVESYFNDKALDARLSVTLDDAYHYEVYEGEELIDRLDLKVRMDRFSGRFYLEDQHANTLHLAKEAGMFYLYDYEGKADSWLQKVYTAIPRIPLVYRKGLEWDDYLPLRFVRHSLVSRYLSLGAVFSPETFIIKGTWRFLDEHRIEGVLSIDPEQKVIVELDHDHGIGRIDLQTYTIKAKR